MKKNVLPITVAFFLLICIEARISGSISHQQRQSSRYGQIGQARNAKTKLPPYLRKSIGIQHIAKAKLNTAFLDPLLIAEEDKNIHIGLRMISEVIALTQKKAIRRVNFLDFIVNALKAATPTIDAHSSFFSKQSYAEMRESTSGKFTGIGVSIISKLPEDDGIRIIDIIEGGPSHKAGLEAGDEIIEVDGEKLRNLSSDEVISKLKGPKGTKVIIKVIRKKKLHEFTLTRDIIKHEILVTYWFKEPNVYYLSLKIFSENATKLVEKLLKKINGKKTNGIILDLRRNPGGILDIAIDMSGLFIDQGSLVVYTKDRNGKIVSEYRTKKKPIFDSDIPIFILIDNFTASASEILAGNLRHYSDQYYGKGKRKLMAFLIGTGTFGKGSVQEVIPISNGCALKITTMLYYLPNRTSLQAAGIQPDFLIKPKIHKAKDMKMVKELFGTETSIKHHITREEVRHIDGKKPIPKSKKEHKKKEKDKKESLEKKRKKALSEDGQIQATLNLINLLNVMRSLAPKKVNTRENALAFLKKHFITDEKLTMEKLKN